MEGTPISPVSSAGVGDRVRVQRSWGAGNPAVSPTGLIEGEIVRIEPGKRGNGEWLRIATPTGLARVYRRYR